MLRKKTPSVKEKSLRVSLKKKKVWWTKSSKEQMLDPTRGKESRFPPHLHSAALRLVVKLLAERAFRGVTETEDTIKLLPDELRRNKQLLPWEDPTKTRSENVF